MGDGSGDLLQLWAPQWDHTHAHIAASYSGLATKPNDSSPEQALPGTALACVQGGSNAIGLFRNY